MAGQVSNLCSENLHHELVPRIAQLRGYVDRRIPKRLSATISADDILQEVWVAAYRTVSTFMPAGPNAAQRWLTTIANSKIVDAIRATRWLKRGGDKRRLREAEERLTSLSELFTRFESPQKTPSGEFRAIERAHAVSIALNRLREDRRRAVYMRHIEGQSHKEIARAMDKTEAAVNSLLYNGLLELRSLLGNAVKYFSDIQSSEADQGPTAGRD